MLKLSVMRQIWKKRAENLLLNLLFLFCLSNLDVVGQTTVPAGSVSGSWNASGSPYLIQGSVIIPDGQTGSRIIPSYVSFSDEEKLVGDAACDHVDRLPKSSRAIKNQRKPLLEQFLLFGGELPV